MKRIIILLILCNNSLVQYGQIIADHTIVDRYDDIPAEYIAEVKKMYFTIAGESHAYAYRVGLQLVETLNSAYDVSYLETPPPETYSTSHLRTNRVMYGDVDNSSSWVYSYGEEDWYTSALAISRTKAGITYCNNNGYKMDVLGFGFCWDPAIKDMTDYLNATQEYIDYCATNGYTNKIIFTTGPADLGYTEAEGYAAYLNWEAIRDYVATNEDYILFDYADILCYNDGSEVPNTRTYLSNTYPCITATNYLPEFTGHISEAGTLRLGKALWWLLARIAGWDGGTTMIPGTWLGGTTDWNTGSNWYGGIVPTAVTNVTIPLTARQPVISSPLTSVCNNMTINSGASLTINAGSALTVNGNLSNSGTLTILSDATNNSGSLIVEGSCMGSAAYSRFLRPENNAGDRHFFSSPVGGQSVSGFIAANSSNINIKDSKYQLWEWKEELSSNNWQIVSSDNLLSGKGYNVDQKTGSDGLLIFTGSVVNSASFTATSPYIYGYTSRTTQYDYGYNNPNPIWSIPRSWINYGGGGWNLMGNPFTSAMEASTFITVNAGKFDPYYQALYVFDGINNVYKYVAASLPGSPVAGSYGNYVQAGQGFYIIALYDGIVFNFNATMQVHNTSVTLLKSAIVEDPWPELQLKVKYGNNEGLTTIVFNSEMTTGLDPGYDIGQFSAGPDIEIYTSPVKNDNSVNFARQALPVINCDKNIVAVGIDSEKGGEVTFSAYSVPLENYNFWLEDRNTGIFTDINNDTYTVSLPANTYGTGRFFIYTSINMPTPIRPQPEDPSVRVWISNDKVIIKGSVSEKAICEVYDLRGQKVLMTHLADKELNIVNMNSASGGAYLVRVVDGLKVTTKKVILL